MDGWPIRRNKAAFSNSSRGVACAAGHRSGGGGGEVKMSAGGVLVRSSALCALVFALSPPIQTPATQATSGVMNARVRLFRDLGSDPSCRLKISPCFSCQ